MKKVRIRIHDHNVPIEIEPSHENYAVDAHLPLLRQHLLRFGPESTDSDILVSVLLGLNKLLAFREANANETDSD